MACIQENCEGKVVAKGLCNRHYLAKRFVAAKARLTPDSKKLCVKCGIEKPYSEFRRHACRKDGHAADCRSCHSIHHKNERKTKPRSYFKRHELKKSFGITIEVYDAMLKQQGGACAICGTTTFGKWKSPAVDHNHETGEIRGLLCRKCNTAIGMLGDNVSLLEAAVAYLKRYS